MTLIRGAGFIGFLILGLANCGKQKSHPDEFTNYNHPATRQLQIAVRKSNALNGTEIIQAITALNQEEREDYLFKEIIKGNIPDFLRTMVRVTSRAKVHEEYQYISYYVLPDYLALGSNEDYFLCPMTPLLGQKIADELNCILPTRKMVDQIWAASVVKMEPQPIPPSDKMTTVPVFKHHNSEVWRNRQETLAKDTLGSLVSGNKKDVIISNLIYSSPEPGRVIIYGWHYLTGKNIQPVYAGHNEKYADYSHGIRLIQNIVLVNDKEMLATDVLKSNQLNILLSDEGIILRPRYSY